MIYPFLKVWKWQQFYICRWQKCWSKKCWEIKATDDQCQVPNALMVPMLFSSDISKVNKLSITAMFPLFLSVPHFAIITCTYKNTVLFSLILQCFSIISYRYHWLQTLREVRAWLALVPTLLQQNIKALYCSDYLVKLSGFSLGETNGCKRLAY